MKRPNTCTNLIRAIKAIAAGTDEVRLSRSLANVIVGQMLPDGVVKGGSSLMFRYGAAFTRYTRDVDTARVMEHEEYIAKLKESLAAGWNGFTADLVEVEPPARTEIVVAEVVEPVGAMPPPKSPGALFKDMGRSQLAALEAAARNELANAKRGRMPFNLFGSKRK